MCLGMRASRIRSRGLPPGSARSAVSTCQGGSDGLHIATVPEKRGGPSRVSCLPHLLCLPVHRRTGFSIVRSYDSHVRMHAL
jgi:hypothetical protein